MLIYLLWETGLYRNQEIGDLFGLTYSSISRRANITRSRMPNDSKFKEQFEHLKSQINEIGCVLTFKVLERKHELRRFEGFFL